MYDYQITSRVADTHRQDLIRQARVRRIRKDTAAVTPRQESAFGLSFRRLGRVVFTS